MKEYDISEKYKRIYQGIVKWKVAGYKGIFQYTERIDIPIVVESICQHIDNLQQEPPYIVIVVPEQKFKDSLRKRIVAGNIAIYTIEAINAYLTKSFKGKDVLFMNTLILLDITNPEYAKLKINKLNPTRKVAITTKVIKPDVNKHLIAMGYPVIDIITKQMANEEGWISPSVIYNIGIEFTSAEKEVYKSLSENISNTYSIFKGKAKMINYDFKRFTNLRIDMVDDDFQLILACHKGVNYVNNLIDKTEHIHSETVRNMLASIMGWKNDLDLTNDYNKQVDMYWNPDNILKRAQSFSESVEKRLALYHNNENKRKAIVEIIEKNKGKILILNEDRSISNYIETLPRAMCYYKGIPSRELKDSAGNTYKYSTGAKKGEPKVFGEIGIRKEAVKTFTEGLTKTIATDTIANECFDVEGLNLIVCTSPYSKPFKTISDNKTEQPYINKVSLIIWLYMQDFTINTEDYKTSKEKEKLIKVQDNINIDIIWTNTLADVKFN